MKRNKKIFVALFSMVLLCASVATVFAQTVPAPSLDLKDAIEVAQQTIRNIKNVKLNDYYIYSVTYTNSSKGTFWYFLFKTIELTQGQEINVKVYMDKKTELSGGFFTKTGQTSREIRGY